MSVSEKTLELNVTHNILTIFRFLSSGAFLQGYTLYNERFHGLDASIVMQNGRLGPSYQFKKPRRRDHIYRFSINNNSTRDQHIKLFFWSIVFEIIQGYSPIFYALPAIADYNTVSRISPNFINSTYFIRLLNLPNQILDNNIHRVEIDDRTNNITVHSKKSLKITKFAKGIKVMNEMVRSYNKSEKIKTIKNKIREIKKEEILSYIQKKYEVPISPFERLFEKNWRFRLKGLILPLEE